MACSHPPQRLMLLLLHPLHRFAALQRHMRPLFTPSLDIVVILGFLLLGHISVGLHPEVREVLLA